MSGLLAAPSLVSVPGRLGWHALHVPRASAALCALLALAASPARSEPPAGSLSGFVRTSDGAPLPGVGVTAKAAAVERTTLAGPEGRYRLAGLPPGDYELLVDAPGLVLSPPARVRLEADEVRLDLALAPAPIREQVVVSATRSDATLSTLGTSASALDADHLAERHASSTLELLGELAGVAVARAGGVGSQASAFVRGGGSNAARVLVDGVPLNEPGGGYDFGQLVPLEIERIELVRGAASSLYGSDALGGVFQILTRRAGRGTRAHAEAEGGSFAWRRGEAAVAGRSGRFDWNAGGLYLATDNGQPNSAFEQKAGAALLGLELGPRTSLRLLARGSDSTTGTPGPLAFGRPDLDASYERGELAASAQLRHGRDRLSQELRLSYSRVDALSLDPLDSGSFVPSYGDAVASFAVADLPQPLGYRNDTARALASYQLEASAGASSVVSAGADLERETGAIGAAPEPLLRPERTSGGVWAQGRFLFAGRVFATLGGRVEKNASYGTRAVPRAALAWRLRGGAEATTLRASAGAGVKEPSFLESFGVSFFARGNPALRPERSRTFDLGLEQRLLGGRLRGEATLFHHEYLDLIAYSVTDQATFQGTFVNLGRTRARGLELGIDAAPSPRLRASARYTHLDGEILESGLELDPVLAKGRGLPRRPARQASLGLRAEQGRLGLGATLLLVGRRSDSDYYGLGLTESPGYTRLDARMRLAISRLLEAFVVAENLLDARFQTALGYPSLGRSIRAGVRAQTGSARP